MMKKFVLLTFNYSGMGGAELYARDKLEYMQRKGYESYIFAPKGYSENTEILIEDLKQFNNGITELLDYYPQQCSPKDIKKTVLFVLEAINYSDSDEVLIESNSFITSCWGELIAQYIQGKNYCFILHENFYGDCLEFFEFKLNRKELAGTYDDSLVKMFTGYKNLADDQRYYLLATNSQTVKDIQYNDMPDISKYDWIIGGISRLEKPYVEEMLKEISIFASNHKDKRILLILIGSDENPIVRNRIKQIMENSSNVTVFVTGILSPIPRCIFEKADVFVSSATSAQFPACEGVPTITIDGNDYKGIGILGYTTSEDLYHSGEDDVFDVNELLEKVLIERVCDKLPFH